MKFNWRQKFIVIENSKLYKIQISIKNLGSHIKNSELIITVNAKILNHFNT